MKRISGVGKWERGTIGIQGLSVVHDKMEDTASVSVDMVRLTCKIQAMVLLVTD